MYQKAVYFYCCVFNVTFVKFTDFNFMIYKFDEYGQIDRDNENPTQNLLMTEGNHKKNPVRLVGTRI